MPALQKDEFQADCPKCGFSKRASARHLAPTHCPRCYGDGGVLVQFRVWPLGELDQSDRVRPRDRGSD